MKGKTTVSTTLASLEASIAEKGKLRPAFVISALGPGNHPFVFEAGDIALGAVNLAKRKRNQDGYLDVEIKRWSKDSGAYFVDPNLMEKAFGFKPDQSQANGVADRRRIRGALDALEMSVHRIKVAGDYDNESIDALVESFVACYREVAEGYDRNVLDDVEKAVVG